MMPSNGIIKIIALSNKEMECMLPHIQDDISNLPRNVNTSGAIKTHASIDCDMRNAFYMFMFANWIEARFKNLKTTIRQITKGNYITPYRDD